MLRCMANPIVSMFTVTHNNECNLFSYAILDGCFHCKTDIFNSQNINF